jgi:hypothetical protein
MQIWTMLWGGLEGSDWLHERYPPGDKAPGGQLTTKWGPGTVRSTEYAYSSDGSSCISKALHLDLSVLHHVLRTRYSVLGGWVMGDFVFSFIPDMVKTVISKVSLFTLSDIPTLRPHGYRHRNWICRVDTFIFYFSSHPPFCHPFSLSATVSLIVKIAVRHVRPR